jgi:hypothetical protein
MEDPDRAFPTVEHIGPDAVNRSEIPATPLNINKVQRAHEVVDMAIKSFHLFVFETQPCYCVA